MATTPKRPPGAVIHSGDWERHLIHGRDYGDIIQTCSRCGAYRVKAVIGPPSFWMFPMDESNVQRMPFCLPENRKEGEA